MAKPETHYDLVTSYLFLSPHNRIALTEGASRISRKLPQGDHVSEGAKPEVEALPLVEEQLELSGDLTARVPVDRKRVV